MSDPLQVHVDFEDCILMGYKVFGTSNPNVNRVKGEGTGQISYTTKGKVRAYVQLSRRLLRDSSDLGFGRWKCWTPSGRPYPPRTSGFPRAACREAQGVAGQTAGELRFSHGEHAGGVGWPAAVGA